MNNKIKEGIEVSKNLLDTLPKNNIKNKNKYKEVLNDTIEKYQNILVKIGNEMSKRYKKYTNINENDELELQTLKISNIKENLYLLNHYNSSYEKLNLDKILYRLNHFYKSDLQEANKNINHCINIFKQVGINLEASDFNYSEYANEYMTVLLNTKEEEKIKESFEKVYWQCPDLLIHIELNIKYLYYKNIKIFEKYIENKRNEFINENGKNILESYRNLVINYDLSTSNSLYIWLNKFINNEINLFDYEPNKINKISSLFVSEEKEISTEEINKLANSSLEYKNYLYFKYLIDDLKEKYNTKKDQKNILKKLMKDIQKKEKLISKYSGKRNKKEKINIKIMNLIKELESLYEELDIVKFKDVVNKKLTEDSSIYEALLIACSNYLYMVRCMKKNDKTEGFELEQYKLIDYILNPYNTIIQNLGFLEDKDISLIISDKYKLSNFEVTKETFDTEEKIDEIIKNSNKINIYNNIVRKIGYDNLKFIIKYKEIEQKEQS